MRWMGFGPGKQYFAAVIAAALISGAALVYAQTPVAGQLAAGGTTFGEQPAGDQSESPSIASVPQGLSGGGQIAEHPLVPALRMAYSGWKTIQQNIRDYTCILVKRERVGGVLGDYQYMAVKVRNHPFSVYMKFLKPADVADREVIYNEGQNKNELQAHEGHGIRKKLGTFSFDPNGPMAMQGNRYPITQLGIANLTHRLIEVAEHDKKYGECDVQFRKGAKVNDRICTIIEVTHPTPRRTFLFHKAVIYLDDQRNIPIRYEAYSWPKVQGGAPVLDEEYTYVNIRENVGLTDADFDIHNPAYQYKESGH